jgi:uncharacterized protein
LGRQVRGKVHDYTVFRNGSQFLGTATVELPSIEMMTSTFRGAGISGEVDMPVIGQFGSMQMTLNWDVIDPAAMELTAPVTHALDLRVVQQVMDTGTGTLLREPSRISVRGITKSNNMGSIEKGGDLGGSTVLEIIYLKTVVNGVTTIEIDKLNGIFIVNGVDYSVNDRAILGL